MEYSEAEKLLIKIDTEMEEMLGPIKLNNYRGSNAYMWELDHRRWMHPDYQKYIELRTKEASVKTQNK